MATAVEMPADLVLAVEADPAQAFSPHSGWDALLQRSRSNSIFLTAGWLLATTEVYAPKQCKPFRAISVAKSGRRVAQAAFSLAGKTAKFVGDGPSDYLDFIFESDLDDPDRLDMIIAILKQLQREFPAIQRLELRNVRCEHGTPVLLAKLMVHGWHAVARRSTIAPAMDMSSAASALKKKSLKRHEQGLSKLGNLECRTFVTAVEILPRLDEFFDQHVRRWGGTSFPSQFSDEINRHFFRKVTEILASSHAQNSPIRLTEIRLDGRLIAAHFGAFFDKVFTWYKPTFDPELREHSPGEVLLKRLIERAIEEGASVFDFTIGDEAFKSRFATKNPVVVDVLLSRSRAERALVAGRIKAKSFMRRGLERFGLLKLARQLTGRG